MLDLLGFGCFSKVVIIFTYVLLLLCHCKPGRDCQKLFAALALHKEMQTYSVSTGNHSAHFCKHSQEGNVVCRAIFGNENQQEHSCRSSSTCERELGRSQGQSSWSLCPWGAGGSPHQKLLPVSPSTSSKAQGVFTPQQSRLQKLPWLAQPRASCGNSAIGLIRSSHASSRHFPMHGAILGLRPGFVLYLPAFEQFGQILAWCQDRSISCCKVWCSKCLCEDDQAAMMQTVPRVRDEAVNCFRLIHLHWSPRCCLQPSRELRSSEP